MIIKRLHCLIEIVRNKKYLDYLFRRKIMEEKTIMLCCAMGMSSGFLASKARKVAKKEKLPWKIEARSEAEIDQYLANIDCLLIGPHYANKLPEFQQRAGKYNVPVRVIPEDIYGTLDGKGLVKLAKDMLKVE